MWLGPIIAAVQHLVPAQMRTTASAMFLLINLLGKNLSVAQRLYETVVLLAIFLPFSYFMDSLMYRSYLKRTGAAQPPKRRGSNGAA